MSLDGYTRAVREGECTDLREFAMTCTRAFLKAARDLPEGETLDTVPLDTYHEEELSKASEWLATVTAYTPEDVAKHAENEWQEYIAAYHDKVREYEEARARCECMHEVVTAWDADPLVMNLKAFMLEKLEEAIEIYTEIPPPLERWESDDEWHETVIEKAKHAVTIHELHWIRDQEVNAQRNEWLEAVKELRCDTDSPQDT